MNTLGNGTMVDHTNATIINTIIISSIITITILTSNSIIISIIILIINMLVIVMMFSLVASVQNRQTVRPRPKARGSKPLLLLLLPALTTAAN